MGSSTTARTRPKWVTELNAFGTHLGDPARLVSLDDDDLLAAAVSAAGGPCDFGEDAWKVPFGLLTDDLREQARLHLVGRLMARNEVVRSLRNRLWITDAHRRDRTLAQTRIEAPVLICGTGRSGTSILHELLAQDPAHRALATWESLHPCPSEGHPLSGDGDTAPALAAAEQEYGVFWNEVTPEYAAMHENGGAVPAEDGSLVLPAFLSDQFMGQYHVPSYTRHFVTADLTPAMRLHRATLQILQRRSMDADRWVLKWPGILSRLPAYLAEYPDARVVITHRDPLKVLPSLVSLMETLMWRHTDHVPHTDVVNAAVHGTAMVFDLLEQQQAAGLLSEDQVLHVRYHDLVEVPWPTMHGLYESLGLHLTPEAESAMRSYLAAKPQGRGGPHRYTLADTGIDEDTARALYAPYMARYDLPAET